MGPAEVIARALIDEQGGVLPEDEPVPEPLLKLAQGVLFALGKADIRLIEPGDVLEREDDKDAGTVKVLLKADE